MATANKTNTLRKERGTKMSLFGTAAAGQISQALQADQSKVEENSERDFQLPKFNLVLCQH